MLLKTGLTSALRPPAGAAVTLTVTSDVSQPMFSKGAPVTSLNEDISTLCKPLPITGLTASVPLVTLKLARLILNLRSLFCDADHAVLFALVKNTPTAGCSEIISPAFVISGAPKSAIYAL